MWRDTCHLCRKFARREGNVVHDNTEIRGIEFRDGFLVSTDKGDFISRYVVNATGPWINNVLSHIGVRIPLRYSLGSIIVLDSITPRGNSAPAYTPPTVRPILSTMGLPGLVLLQSISDHPMKLQ